MNEFEMQEIGRLASQLKATENTKEEIEKIKLRIKDIKDFPRINLLNKKDAKIGNEIYVGRTETVSDKSAKLFGTVIAIYEKHCTVQCCNYKTSVNFENERLV